MRKTQDRYLIRQKEDGEMLTVVKTDQGKMIVFMTMIVEGSVDAFNIPVPWKALEKLEGKMKLDTFNWQVSDRSLLIEGKDDAISLRFMNAGGSTMATETILTHREAELFKSALSKSGFGGASGN
jgi:hypothetical protein